jgi:hypothetical protein
MERAVGMNAHSEARGLNLAPWNLEKTTMAKPNYQFEKRRRDMEKKAKKEEKRKRKLEAGKTPAAENEEGGETPPAPDATS